MQMDGSQSPNQRDARPIGPGRCARLRLGEQLAGARLRASSGEVADGRKPSTMQRLRGSGGCEPKRVLHQLGRVLCGSPLERTFRRVLQGDGDLVIRRIDGERQMSRAFLALGDDGRELAVQLPPLARSDVAVHGRGEQRMREADDAVVAVDDAGLPRGVETVRRVGTDRLLDEPQCRLREGDRREGAPRRRRKHCQASARHVTETRGEHDRISVRDVRSVVEEAAC